MGAFFDGNTLLLACPGGPEIIFLGYGLGITLPSVVLFGVGAACAHSNSKIWRVIGQGLGWLGIGATLALMISMGLAAGFESFMVMLPFIVLGSVFPLVSSTTIIYKNRKPIPVDYPACERCGYNLTGNVSGICPECGRAIGSVDAGATARASTCLRAWL
jgi:hypothetical protein